MESKETPRLDMINDQPMTDDSEEFLDTTKYQQTNLEDLPEPQHQTITIERFVTLINGIKVLPPNPFADITVLFMITTPNVQQPAYYYTPLHEFVEANNFAHSYLQTFLSAASKMTSEIQRYLLQLLLTLLSPSLIFFECLKLSEENPGMLRAVESLYVSQYALTLSNQEFKNKFFDFCKYFSFQPAQSLYNPENIKIELKKKLFWSELGVHGLDKVIYAFMMSAFLKYPQLLEATSILKDSSSSQNPNYLVLHNVLDFSERGWGFHDPTRNPKPVFWNFDSFRERNDATHGETLLIYYKPIDAQRKSKVASLLQSCSLFQTHRGLRNGENNITILDKEFFRRKVRNNFKLTTGSILLELQLYFHVILNHMSFEDAHFQAYLVTNPDYDFNILAIESDNITIAKVAERFESIMKKLTLEKQHRFYYTMYTFRNFIYHDPEGEVKMRKYLETLTAEAVSHLTNIDLQQEFVNQTFPGSRPKFDDDYIIPAPPKRVDGPTTDNEADDPVLDETLGEGEEPPFTLTRRKLLAKLCQSMTEMCYDFVKEDFQLNLVITHEISLIPRSV